MNQVMNKMKTPGGLARGPGAGGVAFYEYCIRRPAAGKAS